MRKIIILFSLVYLNYYGNFIEDDRYELTYKFVNVDNVSETDKINCINTLKRRLTTFNSNAEVKLKSKNEIAVILNAGFEVKDVNKIVANTGKLDFWHCLKDEELLLFLKEADKKLTTDSIAEPISSLVKTIDYDQLPVFSVNDTLKIRTLLNDKKIKNLYTEDLKSAKFLFGKSIENSVKLYAVKSNNANRGIINEESIIEAQQNFNQMNSPTVSLNMTTLAARKWEKMTGEAFENQIKIAIVVNDIVYSAPRVSSGAISGGRTEISGNFTIEEAQELVSVLRGQSRIPKLKFIGLKKAED